MTDDLPDNIEDLVERHNQNHDRIDRINSYNARRQAQKENERIRDKLVNELDVPREKVNELVDTNLEPRNYRQECEELVTAQ